MVLSQCDSPFVTKYYGSFLKVNKLLSQKSELVFHDWVEKKIPHPNLHNSIHVHILPSSTACWALSSFSSSSRLRRCELISFCEMQKSDNMNKYFTGKVLAVVSPQRCNRRKTCGTFSSFIFFSLVSLLPSRNLSDKWGINDDSASALL